MENIHDWINSIVLVILGVAFFSQNSILKYIKSYMDIFKIDEVKKYVALKEENIMMKSMNLLNDNDAIMKMVEEANNNSFEQLKEIYINQMGEEHLELVSFAIEVIKAHPKENRKALINRGLPKTKRYFIDILNDIENDVI